MLTTTTQISAGVIEDNPQNLEIARVCLIHQLHAHYQGGWRSGSSFITWHSEHLKVGFDLLLLDIHMPKESGIKLYQELRELLPKTKIIAWTADVVPQRVVLYQQVGFDGMIGKPINTKRFPLQIQRILAGEAVWEI
jgi:DNA-binding NarL/FixJ family response regulator